MAREIGCGDSRGDVIQLYPCDKETVQRHIDMLLINPASQSEGNSVFLREASDGWIIGVGVGVLAGTVAGEIKGIVDPTMNEERRRKLQISEL